MTKTKNLTPEHLRCIAGTCPSIHQMEDGRLLIVGERASTYLFGSVDGELRHTIDGDKAVNDDEEAIIISPDLLSDYVAQASTVATKMVGSLLAENARLQALVDGRFKDEAQMILNHAEARGGRFEIAVQAPIVMAMVEHLATTFKEMGGENYVCIEMNHDELGPMILSIQRRFGEMPAAKAARLEAENARLREALSGLRNNADGLRIEEACIREVIGNTNWEVIRHWIERADAALHGDPQLVQPHPRQDGQQCDHPGSWQPIETAPKDGTKILLWANGECAPLGSYQCIEGGDDDGTGFVYAWVLENTDLSSEGDGVIYAEDRQPTHWMSLPSMPPTSGDHPIVEDVK
jgi:hypothetical protein